MSAAHHIIDEYLAPPPEDKPIDSLPDYFSEETKRAIREREITRINIVMLILYILKLR